jgi:hypothetical protein
MYSIRFTEIEITRKKPSFFFGKRSDLLSRVCELTPYSDLRYSNYGLLGYLNDGTEKRCCSSSLSLIKSWHNESWLF